MTHESGFVTILSITISSTNPDFAVYLDDASDVSRYVMLLEPDRPISNDQDGRYGKRFGQILSEVNPEYGFIVKRGSLGTPLVLIQQQQTHALWREFKLMKGSSPNQVKPVRVLDVPMKQKFFFGLLEEGQEDQVKSIHFHFKEKPLNK